MKTIFTLLIFFLPFISYGKKSGQALIDSLRIELPRAKEDTSKVTILNRISFTYADIDPDTGLKYATQGMDLAEKLKWEKGIASSYNSFHNNYAHKSQYSRSLEYAKKALHLYEELKDKRSVAASLGNIAGMYDVQGDHNNAIYYHFKALKIAEDISDQKLIATSLMNIGTVYVELSNYSKAQEYYLNALGLYEIQNDKKGTANCETNIASVFYYQKKYDTALHTYQRALALYEELGNTMQIQIVTGNIGGLYLDMKDYARSMEYNSKALSMSIKLGDKEGEAAALGDIGRCYLGLSANSLSINKSNKTNSGNKANLRKAIDYLTRSITIAREIDNLDLQIKGHDGLAAAYKQTGDFQSALENYEAFTHIRDSVFTVDSKVAIANAETQRETALKEKQIELNRLTNIKKRNEQILFILGIALLSIIVLLVVRSYYAQVKTNSTTLTLLKQKDTLMKEIHHRVKNNLQVVSTLLDLQLTGITDEHAKDVMTESAGRVKSISLIHQQLYQNEDIAAIEFSRFAEELLQQVTSVFKKTGQTISLRKNIPKTEIDVDTAVPLGLILNELMTNSYKYAFPNAADGIIEITLSKNIGEYMLVYKDSGPGLPDGQDLTSLNTLGMKLLTSLAKQIGGKINYLSGSKSFVITFKDLSGRKLTD